MAKRGSPCQVNLSLVKHLAAEIQCLTLVLDVLHSREMAHSFFTLSFLQALAWARSSSSPWWPFTTI